MNQDTLTDSSISPSGSSAGAISRRAYEIWEREGRPEGCDLRHWLEAEQELSNGRVFDAHMEDPAPDAIPVRTSRGNSDATPPQNSRAGTATKPGRDNRRGSRTPFAGEKSGAGNSSGQTATRRKSSSAPAL